MSALAQEFVESDPYRLRLARPGPEWVLMDERGARRVSPDAELAACDPTRGACGLVIVETNPAGSLADAARLVLDANGLQDKEESPDGRGRCRGRPCAHVRLKGRMDGEPHEYRDRVFQHQGYTYQLAFFAAIGKHPDGAAGDACFASLSLLSGRVVVKNTTRPAADEAGPGWEVRNGVYQSQAGGLRVTPAGGWNLIPHARLLQVSDEAEVGIELAHPTLFLTVNSEPVGNADPEQWLARYGTPSSGFDATQPLVAAQVAGRSVSFHHVANTAGLTYLRTTFLENARTYTIDAWGADQESDLTAALGGALATLSFLPPRPMERGETPQNDVGEGYSWRGRVYRRVDPGPLWRAPERPLLVSVGPPLGANSSRWRTRRRARWPRS